MPDTTVKTASDGKKPRVTLRQPEGLAILHVLTSRGTIRVMTMPAIQIDDFIGAP